MDHPARFGLQRLCVDCLASALAAAYEAGRADASVKTEAPPNCECDAGSHFTVSCSCCLAKPGEPCHHEVKP